MSEAEMMSKVRYNNPDVTIRPIAPDDVGAVTAFANAMPPHDLIFLSRDIRNDKVVKAWLKAIDRGTVDSLLAIADGKVIATTAIMRDQHSWSPHVADLRVIIAPEWRGKGLGRALVESGVEAAVAKGATKIVAQMTPDQRGAITLFEESGFRPEAFLRDHVRDAAGLPHDLVLFSLHVGQVSAVKDAYG